MTKITVTQVTFVEGGALVAGEPLHDPTKVIVARADAIEAIPLAMAVAAGMRPVVDPPEDSIEEILEKPKDR